MGILTFVMEIGHFGRLGLFDEHFFNSSGLAKFSLNGIIKFIEQSWYTAEESWFDFL